MKDNGKLKTLMAAKWNGKSIVLLLNLISLEASDPTSYMVQDVNVEKTPAYIKRLNSEQTEIKYTMTHVCVHALAISLYKIRRDFGRLVWGYFRHENRLGTTCFVDIYGEKDLVPVTPWDAHELTLKEFAVKINEKIKGA
jgi:hypothetical protein